MQTKQLGKILSLFLSVQGENSRINVDEVNVDEQGVVGDKFHGKDILRSILITSEDSYILAKDNNINIPDGSLGENIYMDFNPYKLTVGDRFQIGESVVLEITQNCTLCKGLSNIDAKLPDLLKHDRGIFAKTIIAGKIKKGDPIYNLDC